MLETGAGDKVVARTLMIRNLPQHLSQEGLLWELEEDGFADLVDLCYSPPRSFHTGGGKGFAFVNFVSEEAAQAFACAWHGSRRFGAGRASPGLNVSAAAIQGREANLSSWGHGRIKRIRDPKFRPFVRD